MADNRDQWTIKGWPYAEREFVIRSARAADVSVAEWLLQAAKNEASRQASQQVFPPGKTEEALPPMTDMVRPVGNPADASAGMADLMKQAMRAEERGYRGAKGTRAAVLAFVKHTCREVIPKSQPRLTRRLTGPMIDGE